MSRDSLGFRPLFALQPFAACTPGFGPSCMGPVGGSPSTVVDERGDEDAHLSALTATGNFLYTQRWHSYRRIGDASPPKTSFGIDRNLIRKSETRYLPLPLKSAVYIDRLYRERDVMLYPTIYKPIKSLSRICCGH